jgi:excisionase family DNA binding protein
MSEGELLNWQEAALFLSVKPSTIRAWTRKGRLASVKLGKLVRYRRSDLEAVIRKGQRTGMGGRCNND